MWRVPELNAQYISRMEDVLAVYEKPYNAAEPVVCIDEKPISLHRDVRPPTPAQPGREARRDNEYQRCGTANVFCAVEPKAGRHFTRPTPHEFARMAIAYPAAKTIHLVTDNLDIHCRKSRVGCYGAEFGDYLWRHFTVRYTPQHGSRRNQAEIEIGLFSRQCLGRRRIPGLAALQRQAHERNQTIRRTGTKISWQFNRQDARRRFGPNKNQFTRL